MLIVACVEWGNYHDRGAEYVAKLYAGARKHLAQPFEFHCLTDDPTRATAAIGEASIERAWTHLLTWGRGGWWNKVELFRPGLFPAGARILYLDLDSLITGSLDELAAAKGIIHLADWGWNKNVYCSSLMVWDHGEHADVWAKYSPEVARRLEGDQDWITECGAWPALPAPWARSYRYHARDAVPADCRVVAFHGRPKPHELSSGWAADLWRSLA